MADTSSTANEADFPGGPHTEALHLTARSARQVNLTYKRKMVTVLLDPYHQARLFVFVVHPRLRRAALVGFVLFFGLALFRAALGAGDVATVLGNSLWLFLGVFVFFPLWNRFIVYPWAKDRPKKDRIGFLAFFEVLPLIFGLWAMFAMVLWGT